MEHAELLQKLLEAMEHYQREDEQRKIEYEQMFLKIQTPSCMVMDVTKNTNKENFTSKFENVRDEIKLVRDSFTCEIGYVSTDIKLLKVCNQIKSDSINLMSAAITPLSQDIYEVQKTLESMESNLQRQKSNKTKTPPKNNVRQPDIVPPDIMDTDIMDIDTVTQLTTATGILKTDSSLTAPKTKSKTVHFNEIPNVKIIECRP